MKRIFQKWLFVFVLGAFVFTCGVSFVLQTREGERSAVDQITLRLGDAKVEVARNKNNLANIKILTNADAVAKAKCVAEILRYAPADILSADSLRALLSIINADEIDIIDANGIITASTVDKYVGYDMNSAAQSREFTDILRDPSLEIAQSPQAIGFDSGVTMQYAGVSRRDAKGIVQIGYVPRRLQDAMDMADIAKVVPTLRIGRRGGVILASGDEIISCVPLANVGKKLAAVGIDDDEIESDGPFWGEIDGEPCLCSAENYLGLRIIGWIPRSEVYEGRLEWMLTLTFCLLVIFISVFLLISKLVQNVVIKGIDDINASVSRITGGDLDELVQVMTNKEFVSLSCGINTMVTALKKAIAEAQSRIDAELQVAKAIQHSALPEAATFANGEEDFDIAAEMFTAKEVGGDFYDFFRPDAGHLVFMVADVSGKGIPAALFMMKCKTLINSIAETELSPAKILTEANERLCEGNEVEMFVTVWLGVLELESGKLTYANAGHNFPLLARADGSFEYVRHTSGLVLAGMEGIRYKEFETRLGSGDVIFLYTDGVTESIDGAQNAYGDDRLLSVLNGLPDRKPSALVRGVTSDLQDFTRNEPQFDDVTMLALRCQDDGLEKLVVDAKIESHGSVTEFIEKILSSRGCPAKALMEIDIAVDEIFSNIAQYSGAQEASVYCGVRKGRAVIRFEDDGRPYDPLSASDPDVTLAAGERETGGLGVFLVKKMMDRVSYEYKDGRNKLLMEKKI